jgi:hypothetical protein
MKTKCFLLSLVLLKVLTFSSYAHAQDDDIVIPDQETFQPTSSGATPPVIIDESDSSDVSDVEEYDG